MEDTLTQPPGPYAARPGQPSPLEPLSFRKAPLLVAALCFALGDCLAQPWSHYRPAWLLLSAVIVLGATACLALRSSIRLAAAPVLALWVIVGFWAAEITPTPSPQAAVQQDADGLSRIVTGRVTRIRELPPTPAAAATDADTAAWDEAAGSPTISFDLAVDSVEHVTPDLSTQQAESGGVRVTVVGDLAANTLRCGDRLQIPLRMRRPNRLGDPGIWQYADYLAAQGISAHASLRATALATPGAVEHDGSGGNSSGGGFHCALYRAQTWAADRLLRFVASRPSRALPAPMRLSLTDAGMLNAMLFGDRNGLTRMVRIGFERTGSFHLFVVSGMHVALLAALVFWVSRGCRLNELAATGVTLTLTTAYAVLTGFGAPVQRALLMSAVFLIARLLSRERIVLNGLGAAALAILVAAPASLFEPGFQMTLLAILAIAGIAIPLGEWTFLPYANATRNLNFIWTDRVLPPHLAQFRVMLRLWGDYTARLFGPYLKRQARYLPANLLRGTLWLAELFLIGIVAEFVMALPMAVYFHRATPLALPANIFSIPLIAVLAPVALITFLLSLISLWLATVPAAATALLLHGITAIIDHVSRLYGADWRVPQPPPAAIFAALALWACCIWAVRLSRRSAWLAVLTLPVAAVLLLWPYPAATTPNALEVTAIDVGQGDSLLVVNPQGSTMLIDAGGPTGRAANAENAAAQSNYDIGEDVVSSYLWSRRIRSLDIVALTHAHSDHMGGMPAVLRNFHPRELWVGSEPDSSAYRALLAEANTLGIAVRHLHAGDSRAWGSVDLRVLAPATTYRNLGAPSNDDSLVLHLQYGRSSALLEGDAEASSERAMLADGALAPVTLLKVGHHGSLTSSTPAFLAAVAPRDAVVSVGRQNTFGHPRSEIIGRLADAHARLYRTDEFGLTQFLLTSDGNITESNPQANPASLW